jgi:hypothetical protein
MGARSSGRRRVAAIGLTAGCALAAAAPAGSQPVRGDPEVRVATTGNSSELVKTLPITRRPGTAKRVVMSMGPHSLGDLLLGDRVRITAEFQVTGNCGHPDPRCVGPIYHFSPKLRGRLILADDDRDTGGPDTLALAPSKRQGCSQRRPDYEHHCVLVFTRAGFAVDDPAQLPCAPDSCFVNFVADAHHPRARRGDLLMVGGLRPDGTIPQDRGRINAVRYRGVTPRDYTTSSTAVPHRRRLPPDLSKRVVYSAPLDRLERGEQLAISATMRTDISRLRYAVRTSARLILADSPNATRQSPLVKRVAVGQGEIAENNGSNCTQDEGTCTTRKVGVLEIRRDAPQRLYVNLITVLGPKVRRAHGDDRVIVRRGGIRVVRFGPELNANVSPSPEGRGSRRSGTG